MRQVSRSAWGARSSRGTDSLSSTRGVKVHYTGSPESVAMGRPDGHHLCDDRVRGIQSSHMDGNGWNDLGYTAVICPHGYVYVGRGPHRLPAANGPGLNAQHYAVCALVGNKGLTQPTDAMLHGIRDAIEWLRAEGDAGNEIKGHRDGYATDCPGGPLYAWVKRGAPRPGSKPPAPVKPPTSKPPAFKRVLKQPPDMHGSDVGVWQRRMKDRGWRIEVDNWYGDDSEAICRAFQREKRLPVTGNVDRKTWDAAWAAPVT